MKHKNNSRRLKRQKSEIVEPYLNEEGYNEVVLVKDGKPERVRVDFLVAKTFIKNPYNLPYVKHLNGIKTDDRAENLIWSNVKE